MKMVRVNECSSYRDYTGERERESGERREVSVRCGSVWCRYLCMVCAYACARVRVCMECARVRLHGVRACAYAPPCGGEK